MCFECFDADKSGNIDEEEFMSLTQSINNADPTFPGNFKRALEEFDVNGDGLIDFVEFKTIYRRYPMILFPAFRLQDRMQKETLGKPAQALTVPIFLVLSRFCLCAGENGWRRVAEDRQKIISLQV